MARIAGVDLPKNKRIAISLSYIYGIGRPTALVILDKAGIDPETKTSSLTDSEVIELRKHIESRLIEGDLRRDVTQNIKRKMEIACYQGLRHRRGLPVRGQRTHTNARTRKGPRKAVGMKRK